jgi:hypothetical protein
VGLLKSTVSHLYPHVPQPEDFVDQLALDFLNALATDSVACARLSHFAAS